MSATYFSEVAEDMHAGAMEYEEREALLREVYNDLGEDFILSMQTHACEGSTSLAFLD